MNTSTRLIDRQLAKRGLYRLPDATRRVTVRAGTLWVTLDHDPRDTILEAGQSFTPDRNCGAVLYALAPASFTVETAARDHALGWRARGGAARELVLE